MLLKGFTARVPSHLRVSQLRPLNLFLALLLSLQAVPSHALGQSLEKSLDAPENVDLTVRNRNGRVAVIAEEKQKGITWKAESPGAPVAEGDVSAAASGTVAEISVRQRADKDRIDLTVHVPARVKVKVEGEAGAVDIIGNLASASVKTNTGTIRADVPVDAVSFYFLWQASRPRFFSDVELPKVKEKAGGTYVISGKLGNKEAGREERIHLDFTTRRGVVLFNIDPAMVPSDLRERPLTEAARAIIHSGNVDLTDAIRKVSPHLFGEYTKGLAPHEGGAPVLTPGRGPEVMATAVAPQLMRLNATVTDRNGRAISGLNTGDFSVYENGVERRITNVTPTSEPFNLVLLLDVSGSVEEHLDFIRKAARSFLNTASPQDRIAIISFRDDVQVISDFTTDRQLLNDRLNLIEAGGGTALYDALAYTLVHQLKKIRAERSAIVILSDGDDNKSFVPFPAVLEATIESGALIYPLYVPSGLIPESSVAAPDSTLDPMRSRYLTITTRAEEEARKLASVSGGVYYAINRLEDLQSAYDDVVAQLRMAYTITYASNAAGPGERRIRVHANRDGASVRLSPAINVAQP